LEGPWVWRIKDRIDRRWMRRYQELPQMNDAASVMRCGGCGAKVPADVLREVLEELRPSQSPAIRIGLDAPDDAAVSEPPPGMLCVQTVDQFRSFIADPYEFAAIAANHCLSDIYAMGATPHSALALVTLPYMAERKVRDDMASLLRGALSVLDEAGASLVGGHTGEGSELAFGLAVTGYVAPEALLPKTGLRPGDVIVLTKPLGTGTLLAADMRGRAESGWLEAALAAMRQSNRAAGELFVRLGASACTDVTGFGLLGHLLEMMASPDAPHVELDLSTLPILEGASALLAAGIHSTLHPANERNRRSMTSPESDARTAILFDPQTAGGLIAGIRAEHAAECLEELRRSGYARASVIGRVCPGAPGRVSIVCRAGARER
jgi:selenide,water dikinase